MDKQKVKGTIDDSAGRAKRQVGEWTGDTGAQVDGAAQQAKGKLEKVLGNVKESVRDIGKKSTGDREIEERDADTSLDPDADELDRP